MTALDSTTRSVRAIRLRALAPRLALYLLITILCFAGIKAILVPRKTVVVNKPAPAPATAPSVNFAAIAYAETFARAYLTWNASNTQARERALAPYLSSSLDPDAGLTPSDGTSESVSWEGVAGEKTTASGVDVTVAAQTSRGLLYVNVPVARAASGSLAIDTYPALVGPPPSDRSLSPPPDPVAVTDPTLTRVVHRALANYLTGAGNNLAADMAHGSVASLPNRSLHLQALQNVNWVTQGSELSAQVTANDTKGNTWTLTYQVGVVRANGRWYVRSIQVNPTSEGSS